jgi:hypothetical protein
MRRLSATLLAAIVASSLAGGAAAGKVAWNEKAKDGKVPVMGFRVDSFAFGKKTWSAHVTLTNLSKSTIAIGDNFRAAIYADSKAEDPSQAIGFALVFTFSPARPKSLAPGASWTGTIGGYGSLTSSGSVRYARLVFGPLRGLPGQKGAVYWITDHALTLPPNSSALSPNVI